jgi:hypothetical protein
VRSAVTDSPQYSPYPPFPAYPPYPPFPPFSEGGGYASTTPVGAVRAPGGGHPPAAGTAGASPGAYPTTPPALPPPVHRSKYRISSIALPADSKGLHTGTGVKQGGIWAVDPSSVPGSGLLRFSTAGAGTTAMLFELDAKVVPNWVAVSVPHSVTDYTRPNIYFHPTPAQAGYKDSDYPTKSGKWPQLFYYMERLGYQLDAARSQQIIVMPFFTTAATNTGIFVADWFGIVSDILTDVRTSRGAHDGTLLQISEVALSSFSVGIVYLDAFRRNGAGLQPLLKRIYDFDGALSSAAWISHSLKSTAEYRVVKYDQGNMPESFHVPRARWANYPQPPPSTIRVHHLIRDSMLLHAATL